MKKLAFLAVMLGFAWSAQAAVIIDSSTQGLYNDGLGDLANLDGPNGFFLAANVSEGDPNRPSIAEPAVAYGGNFGADWLGGDLTGGTWSGLQGIPGSWAVNTESAIIYDFTLVGASSLHIDLGVDNGILVWLNGSFLFGAQNGGGADINEYNIDVAALAAGDHKLQILREDHGGGTGYAILVDALALPVVGVAEPGVFVLLGIGLVAFGLRRRMA